MADMRKFDTMIRLPRFESDPAGAEDGVLYYNTTDNVVKQYLNGSFQQVPASALTLLGLALNDGNIIVGNGSNVSAAVDTASVGDIDADSTNGLTIKAGVIVDADISGSAAITLSKLAALTASRALVSDGSGVISVSSVTSAELAHVSGVTSAIQTQINSKVAKAGDTMSGNLNMGGNKVTNSADPTSATDLATKGYVDAVAEGLKPKEAVRVATTANITIASDLNVGDVIDGVTLADGDRVLVKNQTASENNGIYIAGASPARSSDFDSLTPIDEINGAYVAVQEGTVNQGKLFVQSGTVATLGTDPISFVFFNSSSALIGGDGITITGSTIDVDHDGQGLQFSGAQLALELDGSTLSKSAAGVKVANGGITDTEISATANIDASKLSTGIISNTEFDMLNGVSSNIQSQLDGKASTALSNLASVALNADIVPAAYNSTTTRNLGSASLPFGLVHASTFRAGEYANVSFTGDTTNGSGVITNIADTSSLIVGQQIFGSGIQNNTFISTIDSATQITVSPAATATATGVSLVQAIALSVRGANKTGSDRSGDVFTRSGNTVSGQSGNYNLSTGNSTSGGTTGNINITTGTTSGTRGSVNITGNGISLNPSSGSISANSTKITSLADPTSAQDGATKNYVDTADALKANVSLNNLSSTAVNVDVNPGSDNTLDLGSSSLRYAEAHVVAVHADASQLVLRGAGVDIQTPAQAITLSPGNNTVNPAGDSAVTLGNSSNRFNTIHVTTVNAGASALTLASSSHISANSLQIKNLAAPTDANDAARLTDIPSATAGDIALTSFTSLADNTADQVITGFAFANATVRSFEAIVSVYIDATTDLYAQYKLYGVQMGSSWTMTQEHIGDDITGFSFNITNAGQIRASIGSISGFSASKLSFRATVTHV